MKYQEPTEKLFFLRTQTAEMVALIRRGLVEEQNQLLARDLRMQCRELEKQLAT